MLSLDYPGYIGFTDPKVVLATFGKPARTYHVGADTVLVWNKILLAGLHWAVKFSCRPARRR